MTTVRLIGTISLPTSATAGQVLTWNGSGWAPADAAAGSGTVKKVNGVDPDGAGAVTLTKANIGLGNADNTSDANKPVSTAQQTALDGKVPVTRQVNGKPLSADVTLTASDVSAAPTVHTHTASQVSDSTTVGRAVLTAADAAAARTAIGAGTSNVAIGTTPGTAADAAVISAYVATKSDDTSVVHKTGSETVAGVKTFTSEPVVPTPTASGSAAPKSYVDAQIGTTVRQTDQVLYTRRYSSGVWPVRGTVPAGCSVEWIGPTAPPIDGTYALAGVDIYTVTVS